MANTPAMVVVLTAPRPTSSTPSLPLRRSDVNGCRHKGELYQSAVVSRQSRVTNRGPRPSPEARHVDYADVAEPFRPPPRFAHAPREHDRRETGRSRGVRRLRKRGAACRHRRESGSVGTSRWSSRPTSRRRRARARAPSNAGVLVDVAGRARRRERLWKTPHSTSPSSTTRAICSARCLPTNAHAPCARLPASFAPADASSFVGAAPASGIARLLASAAVDASSLASSGEATGLLEANGFGIVRTLAERDGLVFIEGIKPRASG